MKRYIRASYKSELLPKHIYEIRFQGENHKSGYGFLKKILPNCFVFDVSFDNGVNISTYMLYPEDFAVLNDLGEYSSLTSYFAD